MPEKELETKTNSINSCYHSLWAAVVLQAIRDYKTCNPNILVGPEAQRYSTAKRFLEQDWVYDSLDIDLTGQECLDILDKKSLKDLESALFFY